MKHKAIIGKLAIVIVALALSIKVQKASAEILFQSVAELNGDRTLSHNNINSLSRDGMHWDALMAFNSRRKTDDLNLSEQLAAARSAWALGHIELAREIWDEVLADPSVNLAEQSTKYDVLLSRAIMELQEHNYEEARIFAEKGAEELEASDLRSQFWLVIAESLAEQKIVSQAEKYYLKAVEEGSENSRSEALYLLGACQQEVGKLDEARYKFTEISLNSSFAPKALLKLIEIDFAERDYDSVLTWLAEAQNGYPAVLDDPWLAYAEVKALVEAKRLDEARNALLNFKKKYSESDGWYILAEAALNIELVHDMYSVAPQKPVGTKP